MTARTYWLDLFTGVTWQEFLAAGATVSGFREKRWSAVQQVRVGDYFICYLAGVSRFVGILEVTKPAYRDDARIWKDDIFPCRVGVKAIVALQPETAVPIRELEDQLSIFRNLKDPKRWSGPLRGSPARWGPEDGEAIVQALLEAQQNPQVRPVDPKKLVRRPRPLESEIGPVTIPDNLAKPEPPDSGTQAGQISDHTEIQFLLLKLGRDMGFNVWVARNDRGRVYEGRSLADTFSIRENLPLQFDEPTTRTIEYIDALWLKGNAIVAAFEVESTTSIYSGLLRMSDLIAMQPNLNIPLYIVAPDERRDKVLIEVNRPTFSRLLPPLSQVCRYIPFRVLRHQINEVAPFIRYLKPEFLEELSEGCEIE